MMHAPSSLLAGPLLARHLHALGSLAGACVRLRVLTADRQATPVAQAAVAGDLLQPFDVLRAFAPQVALDREAVVDRVAQLGDLVLGEVADIGVRTDPDLVEDLAGRRPADAVDIGEPDFLALVQRQVYAGDTCHERP
jgi:hypothetical protein